MRIIRFCCVVFLLGIAPVDSNTNAHNSAEQQSAQLSYWVWAGHSVSDFPNSVPLYIHQATFERQRAHRRKQAGASHFVLRRQGVGPVALAPRKLWITYRVEGIIEPRELLAIFDKDVALWSLRGNTIIGLQIDFDSPTRKLDEYSRLLHEVRGRLSHTYQLSVTGLADWAANASDGILRSIGESTDEIVFQLYRGKLPVDNFDRYVAGIARVPIPFRIGVLESQLETLPPDICKSSNCRGIVIFPLKDA